MLRLDYDENSPVTGKKSVLVEYDPIVGDTVKICMQSGYQTYMNTWHTNNVEFLEEYELQLPIPSVNSKIVDDFGNVWYKTFMQSPNAFLFPDVDDNGDDLWCVAPVVLLSSDPNAVQIKVPIDDQGNTETRYLDLQSATYFDALDFETALFEFQYQITKNKSEEEN